MNNLYMLVVPNITKMKNSTSKPNSLKFICNIFGHRYEVSKKVTSYVKEYTCKCCKKQVTTDGHGGLTELTPMFREINTVLEHIYRRRSLRLKTKSHTSSIYKPLQSA